MADQRQVQFCYPSSAISGTLRGKGNGGSRFATFRHWSLPDGGPMTEAANAFTPNRVPQAKGGGGRASGKSS
jgi:hypothetical protein